MIMRNLLAFLILANQGGDAFVPRHHHGRSSLHISTVSRPLKAIQQEEQQTTSNTNDEVKRLKQEAERMRLEAEQMDVALTLKKIEALETKLNNKSWLDKHPDQEADLRIQVEVLNDRLLKKPPKSVAVESIKQEKVETPPAASPPAKMSKTVNAESSKKPEYPISPRAGFEDADLALYIPIAEDIEKRLPNATVEEKLEAFRTAPELQENFQTKIQELLVGPLKEMQRLEQLKQEYLDSNSSKEKERLKREIDQLEGSVDSDGPFVYTDSIYIDNIPPLTEEEITERVKAVGALPQTLITLYKQRNGLDDSADLRLAVELNYFELQLQLLEQVRFEPMTDDVRDQFIKGFTSLPPSAQDHLAKNYGLENGRDAAKVLEQIKGDDSILSPFMKVVEASSQADLAEYNDIEFVDRSRFLEEFHPAIGAMEGSHPSYEDVESFASDVLNKKFFMVSSKPERVAGGYYIRGSNKLEDDDNGSRTASDKLIEKISEKLSSSPLADKLEFFYILDPTPPTDEEIEMLNVNKPIIVVTTKDADKFYSMASPLTKSVVTFSGLFSTMLFAIGSCALNPVVSNRFTAAMDAASDSGAVDVQWLIEMFTPILLSILAIQFVHEFAHRLVAWKDKFKVGVPSIVPSISTGLIGSITALQSPPPNFKSLFDFAIAGPLAGLTLSLILLVTGLEMTATMGFDTPLPVLPVELVRASSLGAGLVELFLGKSAVLPNQPVNAVVEMHPLAIAGFVGCIVNALALLPLGHTDGGRISLTMFGRRGGYIVKSFTTLLLCASGLFGLDEANILIVYILFVTIWQREMERPIRNEVDELDFPRGLLGISTACLVGLILIPML